MKIEVKFLLLFKNAIHSALEPLSSNNHQKGIIIDTLGRLQLEKDMISMPVLFLILCCLAHNLSCTVPFSVYFEVLKNSSTHTAIHQMQSICV